jgi:hypothetical protein
MGVRYSDDLVNQLLEGIQTMRESTTYQAILREGRITGEQQLLLRLGTKRFGEPDATTVAAIEAIQDIDRLEALGERILDPGVRDWDDLLRTPRSQGGLRGVRAGGASRCQSRELRASSGDIIEFRGHHP